MSAEQGERGFSRGFQKHIRVELGKAREQRDVRREQELMALRNPNRKKKIKRGPPKLPPITEELNKRYNDVYRKASSPPNGDVFGWLIAKFELPFLFVRKGRAGYDFSYASQERFRLFQELRTQYPEEIAYLTTPVEGKSPLDVSRESIIPQKTYDKLYAELPPTLRLQLESMQR
jgi:hypothetical protein